MPELGVISFQSCLAVALHFEAHNEVISIPSRAAVVVGIYEQQHPVLVRVWRHCAVGAHIEVHVFPVGRHLRLHNVVASAVVGVSQSGISVMVAVVCVAFRVEIIRLHVFPFVRYAVRLRLSQSAVPRYFPHAFIFSDVLYHLHVVVVGVLSLHGLYGPVELGVVLIDEIKRVVLASEECCWSRQFRARCLAYAVFPRRPFVPVVQVYEVRVGLQRLVPSVLEVYAVSFGMLHLLAEPRHECLFRHVAVVQLRFACAGAPALACYRQRMLCGSHRHLLHAAVVCGSPLQRRQLRHTFVVHLVAETPVVLSADIPLAAPVIISPPHISHGEKILHFMCIVLVERFRVVRVAVVRIGWVGRSPAVVVWIRILHPAAVSVEFGPHVAQQQRFAVPVEPEILI